MASSSFVYRLIYDISMCDIHLSLSSKRCLFKLILLSVLCSHAAVFQFSALAQKVDVFADPVINVYFDEPLQEWEGFGVNYVQTAQTRDYDWKQDYSGFSHLSEQGREDILDLIFGEDGLQPAITKIFLDPFHEGLTLEGNDNRDPYEIDVEAFDHTSTTEWICFFNLEGLNRTRALGRDLTMITTLYGPTPWMTTQRYMLGRDLDPAMKEEMAEYMVAWVRYLTERLGLPVKYVSLHNEGDAYYRWPRDGSSPGEPRRDYNLYWPPQQVAEMIPIVRKVLDHHQLFDVGVSPGETQNWYRFDQWGYARAILRDDQALEDLALITSHSFAYLKDANSIYYGDFRSTGQDLIQKRKPDVKTWVTSCPWSVDGLKFLDDIRLNIYQAKANAVIPWALIRKRDQWIEEKPLSKDEPLGRAFEVHDDGTYSILPNYYVYKQVTRAGKPGMSIATVEAFDPSLSCMAFASNSTAHPDAFVIVNQSEENKEAVISVKGTNLDSFRMVRTSDSESYKEVGVCEVVAGTIEYSAPARSATTFFGVKPSSK